MRDRFSLNTFLHKRIIWYNSWHCRSWWVSSLIWLIFIYLIRAWRASLRWHLSCEPSCHLSVTLFILFFFIRFLEKVFTCLNPYTSLTTWMKRANRCCHSHEPALFSLLRELTSYFKMLTSSAFWLLSSFFFSSWFFSSVRRRCSSMVYLKLLIRNIISKTVNRFDTSIISLHFISQCWSFFASLFILIKSWRSEYPSLHCSCLFPLIHVYLCDLFILASKMYLWVI